MTTTFTINPPLAKLVDANGVVTSDWYRWFSRIQGVAATFGNVANGSFLTLSSNPDLPSGRVFTPSPGQLTATDGGAGSTYTLGLANTAVTPNPYGGATKTVSFTVDAKGRLIAAAEFTLSTTNIVEGTNLYYTDARARAAVSAVAPLSYNSGTGAFSVTSAALTRVDDTNVTLTLGGTPASALLAAVSLTLGWSGTLAVTRGGTGTGTAFTAGSVVFAGASGVYAQDNANFFWDDSNNRLGLGTASPASTLHVDGGAITTGRFGSSGAAVLRRAEGTAGSPTQIVSNVVVMNLQGRGYDGSAYRDIASVQAYSDGTVSSSSSPGYLSFQTTPSGSTTNTERMRVTSSGNIHTPAGATAMTDGFFYIPAAAGVPSGAPTAITGAVPMYYDTTNNHFYVYNGAWKKVLLA